MQMSKGYYLTISLFSIEVICIIIIVIFIFIDVSLKFKGYFGDPYRSCQAECVTNSECPSHKPSCVYNQCVDPCKGSCGHQANCQLRGATPICSCPKDMTGDPFVSCRPFEKSKEFCIDLICNDVLFIGDY